MERFWCVMSANHSFVAEIGSPDYFGQNLSANDVNNSLRRYNEERANSTEVLETIATIQKIAYVYLTPIIIAFGIFGDMMTIFILSHPVLRRSVIYMYLLALAVTDLFTMLSVIPMILWIVGVKSCQYGAAYYYAHVGFPLANALMGASVWIVCFLTLGQYVAVCHPFSLKLRSKRVCLYLTGLAYFLSFTVYIPWAWKKSIYAIPWTPDCPFLACDNPDLVHHATWFKAYQWVREVLCRLIPFLLIAFFNICILLTYRRTKAERLTRISRTQKETLAQKSEKEEKRLWMLLVGIVTLFFVCTIPAAPLTILVTDKMAKDPVFEVIRAIINILEFTKFALNFYFYCLINPDIRRLALRRLTCTDFYKPTHVGGTRNNFQLSTYLKKEKLDESVRKNRESMLTQRNRSLVSRSSNDRHVSPRAGSVPAEQSPQSNCRLVERDENKVEVHRETSGCTLMSPLSAGSGYSDGVVRRREDWISSPQAQSLDEGPTRL